MRGREHPTPDPTAVPPVAYLRVPIAAAIHRIAPGTILAAADATRTNAVVSTTGRPASTPASTMFATSSAVCTAAPIGRTPARPSVVCAFSLNPVSTGPGRTTSTRTPVPTSSARSDIDSASSANFVAAYAPSRGAATTPATDDIITIVPPHRVSGSSASCASRNEIGRAHV